MIISGFPGVGKTYLSTKYSNIIDLDGMPYIYKLTPEQEKMSYEQLKGLDNRIKDENWQMNYIEDILEQEKKYDVVLICQHKELLECLDKRGIEYIIVFPEKTCKEEYAKRYKDRGNHQIYIDKKIATFDNQIEILTKKTNVIWQLKRGEYLEDRLLKEGVLLKERK